MNPIYLIFLITIKYSRYWPPAGGTNCSAFVDGVCVSRMASGAAWELWIDRACACPAEWPFGTVVELDDQEWICMDRGGKIRFDEADLTFVDFLSRRSAYDYGELVEVKVSHPIPDGIGWEVPLLELEVLTLDDLRTSEVNSTDRDDEVSPSLKRRWELFVTKFSENCVEPYANYNAEDNSRVAFHCCY